MKEILLCMIVVCSMVSCSLFNNDPDEIPSTVFAEAEIGPAGGVVEAEGITIAVPHNAIASTVNVKVFQVQETNNNFGDQ